MQMSTAEASTSLRKYASAGLEASVLLRPGFNKLNINAYSVSKDRPFELFETVADIIRKENAQIVGQNFYGVGQFYEEGKKAMEAALGEQTWPSTWLEGAGDQHQLLPAAQIFAISGVSVEPIWLGGRIVGGSYEDRHAHYCFLCDIRPKDTSKSRDDQSLEVMETIETALDRVGMDFTNVIRTWFYNDDILPWYDDFNCVRTQFFTERKVFQNLVPASTGVGVRNHAGAALTADTFAMKAKHDDVVVQEVSSPLQCPAPDYLSSFSRAVEVRMPDHRRLYISGTASISPDGATEHIGDTEKQIDLTMRVVQAILENVQMDWSNVHRAVGYFKHCEDAPLLAEYCRKNGLPPLPVAIAQSTICRDNLLFEIEADAVAV